MLPTASRASRLGEQIGYLSRYARILSGNRIFAADCVANLLTEAQDVKAGMQVRQLYRLFTDRYNRVQLFYRKSAADDPNDATAYLASPSRQAMLLVGLEQFSQQDAAYILDVDVPQLDDLIARGSREIADEAPADVLILHDEPITAMMWEDELRALGHRVLGIGRTRGDALALADKARPELIIARARYLADGSRGTDVVEELLAGRPAGVIFLSGTPDMYLDDKCPERGVVVGIDAYMAACGLAALVSQTLFFKRGPAP